MSTWPWVHREPPTRGAVSSDLGRWRPLTPADLSVSRRQLGAALHDGARPPGTGEGAVEQLLLVFEELASNGLRHGGRPVEVAVAQVGRYWIVEVSDASADRPPAPAGDRDPALGGLGLPLVATLCADHGWTIEGDRKVVWASLDRTRADPDVPPGR